MDDGFQGGFSAFLIVFFGGMIFLIHSCDVHENSPEYKAEMAAQQKACATPVLVAEKDDVKLYAINYDDDCNGRRVYFSKSGTHTTHSEAHGKTSTTVDDDVSNSN